jgi:hypothetical protein
MPREPPVINTVFADFSMVMFCGLYTKRDRALSMRFSSQKRLKTGMDIAHSLTSDAPVY